MGHMHVRTHVGKFGGFFIILRGIFPFLVEDSEDMGD